MSTYIKLSTMQYPLYIGDIEIDPIGMDDFAIVNIDPFPEYDYKRYQVFTQSPEQIDGQWRQGWAITPIPDEEGAVKVRKERNAKLAESDWTQIPDVPVDKQAWATYRQALRDITTQTGFPWEIVWPDAP